jgi:hypothetical protein
LTRFAIGALDRVGVQPGDLLRVDPTTAAI